MTVSNKKRKKKEIMTILHGDFYVLVRTYSNDLKLDRKGYSAEGHSTCSEFFSLFVMYLISLSTLCSVT